MGFVVRPSGDEELRARAREFINSLRGLGMDVSKLTEAINNG